MNWIDKLRLPGPAVLPVAGVVVGLYGGLAAGLFFNLILVVSTLFLTVPRWVRGQDLAEVPRRLADAIHFAPWHGEVLLIGVPLIAAALWIASAVHTGGAGEQVRWRLRLLALLALGAMALYYPLVLLSAVNTGLDSEREVGLKLGTVPIWLKMLAPALGGIAVGHLLRKRPETHGHGVPEVVQAIQEEKGLSTGAGLLKLVASALTIGSGGSAGREGPIVYVGAALASGAGRTLGFSRRELSTLLASGAGAGIAASFNAPLAGAMFGMEIILRNFDLKVFSPIILASVTATLVGTGLSGAAPMLRRVDYQLVSGWELLAYAALGLLTGAVAFAFIRALHGVERLFSGHSKKKLSRVLGGWPAWARAGSGGLLVGGMVVLNPAVWGTGHAFVNAASAGELSLGFLVVACGLKLLGTALTVGSGGSGGTFFPATVMGAMAGGAFGRLIHAAAPNVTAPSGAYALVGMGGAVAGLNRGPLTGMLMVYELSGNYAIILPLMVTCTLASAFCHVLLERGQVKVESDRELLRSTKVSALMVPVSPVLPEVRLRELTDALISSEHGALPVLNARGELGGVAFLQDLRELWRDDFLGPTVNAQDVARTVPALQPDQELADGLDVMDQEDVDELPVVERREEGTVRYAILSRTAIRRFLHRAEIRRLGKAPEPPVAAGEV